VHELAGCARRAASSIALQSFSRKSMSARSASISADSAAVRTMNPAVEPGG
jgi:hypothetical protein